MFRPQTFHYKHTSEEAEKQRALLGRCLSILEDEKALRESKQGHAKRPHTKRIKELEQEIAKLKALLKDCPPEPKTEEEARAFVVGYFGKYVAEFEQQKNRFLERFAVNPAYAIEWGGISIVIAQNQAQQAQGLISFLDENDYGAWFEFFVERLEDWETTVLYTEHTKATGVNWDIERAGKAEAVRLMLRDLRFRFSQFERLNEAVKAGRGEL